MWNIFILIEQIAHIVEEIHPTGVGVVISGLTPNQEEG